MNWEVTYVTYIFKDKKGKEIEKTKTYKVMGEDVAEAERNFLNKNIKFKKIKSIVEDKTNTIGNICPELLEIRNKMSKSEKKK
ncbi:MAG: hypothetical protein M0R46_11390 [Candidatus Muirbacterium halophilum]|nr:hypothetical protein [Candidatus Muirbacterium halophilum]